MDFYVYILRCSNGTYYTGTTSNLTLRISQHMAGSNPKAYTYNLRPVELVWSLTCSCRVDALDIEKQIKGWSHAKKKALIENDFNKIHQIVVEERRKREGRKKS